MEASPINLSLQNPPPKNLEKLTQKLLKHGIHPSPKTLHNLRKKHLQKSNRRISKLPEPPIFSEESHFETIKSEYKKFTRTNVNNNSNQNLVGKPWEGLDKLRLKELCTDNNTVLYDDGSPDKLNPEHLSDLSDIVESERDKFSWLLDNDIEFEERWFDENEEGRRWERPIRTEAEAVKLVVNRLSCAPGMSVKDWKFTRVMRHSGLQFTEAQMLRIVEGLGNKGQWRHALSVVEWVYTSKEHKQFKSRFVYTKLLAVLGRARKPREALRVFNLMRGDAHIYPDMAAYHSLAVTLGQGGLLKELLSVIESMKEKPKKISNMRRKNWKPELQPDIVIFNAVLNACVSSCQWKGVSWVFQQLRKNGLRPNGASYGLAMEVMLNAGKYDLVHEFFGKMKRNGEALKAPTYKVLVKALWAEGKVNEAVQAVRDMERRGVIGAATVYYELARCLCFYGRWQEAILEVEKLESLRPTRPLAVTFTGMIMSCMDGGHIHDCISIFEHTASLMAPDIGIINAMLKVYGRSDMFLNAKDLFEKTTKRKDVGSEIGTHDCDCFPKPDAYTFGAMLEASASALQWEYFEYVYKEMALSGYQLNQRKHSALLVEASTAGKWHLLEHAFDSILEAGEIPPVSFFTEMACQAIIRDDYERAVNIINTMAHASFQVTFQDWINLFDINRERIDRTNLSELHKKLESCDLVKEPTVLNLSKALDFVCDSPGDSLNSISSIGHIDKVSEDSREEESDGLSTQVNGLSRPTRLERFGYDLASSSVSPLDSDDLEFEHIGDEYGDSDDDDEFNFELIIPRRDVNDDDSRTSGIPTANQILEIWKKK